MRLTRLWNVLSRFNIYKETVWAQVTYLCRQAVNVTCKVNCRAALGERRRGAQLPFPGHWARDAWPVQRLQTHGYFPSRRASPPFWTVPNYTARWQGHMCVNNLPKIVTWKWNGRQSNPRPLDNKTNSLPFNYQHLKRLAKSSMEVTSFSLLTGVPYHENILMVCLPKL